MEKFTLHLRCTHKYRDGWDSLDQWQELGPAKVLERRNFRDDGEGYSQWTKRVIVPRSTISRYGIEKVERAIGSTLSYSNCQHEHDCCGCVSVSADAEHRGGREFLVRVSASRNI
jgi:hypothetical protein